MFFLPLVSLIIVGKLEEFVRTGPLEDTSSVWVAESVNGIDREGVHRKWTNNYNLDRCKIE